MKLFQIAEDDLQKLENTLPKLQDVLGLALNRPDVQVMLQECKEIISNVRWNYGPPSEVHIIDAQDRTGFGLDESA